MMKKLYYNGTVLTMDAPLYAEAVCTENGRICGVGKTETLLSCCAGKETEKIDLAGRTLMPAFLDAHSFRLLWMKHTAFSILRSAFVLLSAKTM